MPRGFTEKEKEKIRENLILEGRQLFSRYGLKKTSIKDLTKRVGIAQGTFYKFYSSKEELYFEIIEKIEAQMKQELLNNDFLGGSITRDEFRRFLKKAFNMIDQNPLLKNIYKENEYRQLIKKLPEEKIKSHIENDIADLKPLLDRWYEAGCLKDRDFEAISGLLRGLFLLTLHRQEIGDKNYEKTINLLIDLMAEGLIKGEDSN
ncbi:MAG: TetR/AcrR family transcriptional regulator [Candidatus Woesearchaeota archaeon]